MSPFALRAVPLSFLAVSVSVGLTVAACAKSPVNSAKSASTGASASSSSEPRIERIVVSADEIATVSSGGRGASENDDGAMPSIFVLGRSNENARLFLRFTVHLPKNGVLRSANLLLSRTGDIDMAPAPIELHATRIVDPWDARSITWPFQPRIEEVRAPHVTVVSASAKIVRLDVKSIVQDWPLRDPNDQGIAVISDKTSSTGTSFAYMSRDARPPELEILWAFFGGPPSSTPSSINDGSPSPGEAGAPASGHPTRKSIDVRSIK